MRASIGQVGSMNRREIGRLANAMKLGRPDNHLNSKMTIGLLRNAKYGQHLAGHATHQNVFGGEGG